MPDRVRPDTTTGVLLLVVVPTPSWPDSLWPQQRTLPLVYRPQVWLPPTLTDAHVLAVPTRGTLPCGSRSPTPVWPYGLRPQQYRRLAALMPHALWSPASTALYAPSPLSAVGTSFWVLSLPRP